MWSDKFLSYCICKDCDEVLLKDGIVPPDADVLEPKADMDKIMARKSNKVAFSLLMLADKILGRKNLWLGCCYLRDVTAVHTLIT